MMGWQKATVSAVLSLVFTTFFYLVVSRSQKLRARPRSLNGEQVLEMTPNRVFAVLMPFGFLLFSSVAVCWWFMVLPDWGKTVAMGPGMVVFVLSLGVFATVMALLFLVLAVHLFRVRILLSADGITSKGWRGLTSIGWDEIKELKCRFQEIVIVSENGNKIKLDSHWNGLAFLYFYLECFLQDEQWADARADMERELFKKKGLEEARAQFEEIFGEQFPQEFRP
jgi:hypothetical protein